MNSFGTSTPDARRLSTSLPTRLVGRTVARDQKVTKMKSSLTVLKFEFFFHLSRKKSRVSFSSFFRSLLRRVENKSLKTK